MKLDVQRMMRLVPQAATSKASAAERASQDAKVLDALHAKLPGVPIYSTHLDDRLLAFRPATETEWARCETFEERGATSKQAVIELVFGCLLHPSKDELSELAQHLPALLTKLAGECVKISGLDDGLDFKRAR
jgi:hypothetical protein